MATAAAAAPPLGGPNIIYLNSLRTSFLANTDPPTNWYFKTLRGSLRDFHRSTSTTSDSTGDKIFDKEESRKEEIIDDIMSQAEGLGYRFCPKRNRVIENTPRTKKSRRSLIRQSSRDLLRYLANEENFSAATGTGLVTKSQEDQYEWSELLRQTIASETRVRKSEEKSKRVVNRKLKREMSKKMITAAAPALGSLNIIYLDSLGTSFLTNADPPTNWYIKTLRSSLRDFHRSTSTTSDSTGDKNTDEEENRKEEIIDDIMSQAEGLGYRFCTKGNHVIENTPSTKAKRGSLIRQNSRDLLRCFANEESSLAATGTGLATESQEGQHKWNELLRQTIASETRVMKSEEKSKRVVNRKLKREISITKRNIQREDSRKSMK